MTRAYFATFTPKRIADSHKTSEVLVALSLDGREEVDAAIAAGEAAGGNAKVRDTVDVGFLYNRAIEDPDGHILELLAMVGDMPAD
jgi:uncharacterized protein